MKLRRHFCSCGIHLSQVHTPLLGCMLLVKQENSALLDGLHRHEDIDTNSRRAVVELLIAVELERAAHPRGLVCVIVAGTVCAGL